jgi:cholesterol transport system auxiliary component
MKKIINIFLIALAAVGSGVLGGCATQAQSISLYDLGSIRSPMRDNAAADPAPALTALSVADVNAPAWLDSQMMYYRLAYANDQQPRPYANSRWSMPPAQLFGKRLKSRLAQSGIAVLSSSDGVTDLPLLRVEADDFTQLFDSPGSSSAHIAMRASVLDGRTLRAQKTFIRQVPAPSADAPGGAQALAAASDAIIHDMAAWLATLPPKK